jgi:hypothetical protein
MLYQKNIDNLGCFTTAPDKSLSLLTGSNLTYVVRSASAGAIPEKVKNNIKKHFRSISD